MGAVNWIGDVDTRKRLASYYDYTDSQGRNLDYVPPYRETLRRAMPYAVQHAITTQCPERITVGENGEARATLARACVPSLPAAQVEEAVVAIHRPDLKLDLNRLVSDIDIKLGVYDRLTERARALDAQLAQRGD